MSKLDRESVIYCAGLYEGEGHVSSYLRGGKRHYMQLIITMCDLEPLERFADTFDIGQYQVGSLGGPYTKNGGTNKKPFYKLRYSNFEHVQFVVAAIWPWLSPRRKEQYVDAVNKWRSV